MLQNGSYPLCLVSYFNGNKKRYRLGIELTQEQWSKLNSPKLRDNDLKELRIKIDKYVERAYDIAGQMPDFSFDEFERRYFSRIANKINMITLSNVTDMYIKDNNDTIKHGTKVIYESSVKTIIKYKGDILIKCLTSEYIKNLDNWLKTERNLSQTTVSIYFRHLRSLCNYSVKKGYMTPESYPFKDYSIPQSRKHKRNLSNDEIKAIFDYTTDIPEEEQSRDFWIFSYLCSGMNFSDIARLKYSNIEGDRIKFVRSKTKNTNKTEVKEILIHILPEIQVIINKYGNTKESNENYIFNILKSGLSEKVEMRYIAQFIKTTNKYLKRIAVNINIHDLTTYHARHSFATRLKRAGVSIEYISEQLGHSSLKVTESYLD